MKINTERDLSNLRLALSLACSHYQEYLKENQNSIAVKDQVEWIKQMQEDIAIEKEALANASSKHGIAIKMIQKLLVKLHLPYPAKFKHVSH